MPKKDFTVKKDGTIDPIRARATKGASDTKDTKDAKEEKRFPARFTPAQWAYLQELKWQTRRSITEILQAYVEEDMKTHPEIIASIDELNG